MTAQVVILEPKGKSAMRRNIAKAYNDLPMGQRKLMMLEMYLATGATLKQFFNDIRLIRGEHA
jgi:hypothetical protein